MNEDRGSESEDRFYRLLSDPSKLPDWFDGVFPSSDEADKEEGIDFYIFIKGGKTIEVDVKSSFVGRKHSQRKRRKRGARDICFVVIKEELSDDEMRDKIISVLEKWK